MNMQIFMVQRLRLKSKDSSLMNQTTTMDIIDLISPPTSPEIITPNNNEYKIQYIKLNKKNIVCINLTPYLYSDLVVILDDLVQKLLPSSNQIECANLLFAQFNTALYRGDYYHRAMLRSKGFMGSDVILMAKLKDVQRSFKQLKKLVTQRQRRNGTGTAGR